MNFSVNLYLTEISQDNFTFLFLFKTYEVFLDFREIDSNFDFRMLLLPFWEEGKTVSVRPLGSLPKGQLISKCVFGVPTFIQKTNENKSTSGISCSRHQNNQIYKFRIPNILFTCLINSRARHSAIYKLKSRNLF